MDINHTIQFIKSCKGLSLDKAIFYKVFIVLPIIFLPVFFCAQAVGKEYVIASAIVFLFIFAADVFYLLTLVKKLSLKYKLFFRTVIFFNCIVPLFYTCCLIICDIFGLKSFLLYYFLPFFAISLVFIAAGIVLSQRTIRQKSKAVYPLLCSVVLGMRVWISRKTNVLMAENLSETAHFLVIAVLMLLVSCLTFSIMFFDLWRYYYFKKLEKAGIVTEDILKPDKQ